MTMSMIVRQVVWMLMWSFLVGCAAAGKPFTGPEPTPQGMARLYFYRPASNVRQMESPEVVINGKFVGWLKNGGFLTATVPADRLSTVGFPANVFTWPFPSWTHEFRPYSGQTAYIRLDIFLDGMGVRYRTTVVEEPVALKEIGGLHSSADE
jgi:hypothetical protein